MSDAPTMPEPTGRRYLDDEGDLRPDVTPADLLLWADGVCRSAGPVTVQATLVHGLAAALRAAVAAETALAAIVFNQSAARRMQAQARVALRALVDVPDQPTPTRRLAVNPEPLRAEPIPVCRQCGKRAPWCSCGAADYDVPDQPNPEDNQ